MLQKPMPRPRNILSVAAAIIAAAGMHHAPAAPAIDAHWTGVALRQVAARLSGLGGVAIVVDRRLDPTAAVTLSASDEPLEKVLETVAAQAGAEVALLAGHARITPVGGAARVRAAESLREQEIRRLAPALQRLAQARRAWSWPEAARPRDLVAAAAAEAGIAIEGLDTLPHDHFPAADLPPLPLAERLDLVLLHFDRRVEWKAEDDPAGRRATFRIVPIAATAAAPPGKTPWRVTGARPPRQPEHTATYSLKVAAPLDELLATLAKRFGLSLDLDRQALEQRGVAPREIIRLDVTDVSRDTLLDAVLAPLGLGWRIEGATLSVSIRKPDARAR